MKSIEDMRRIAIRDKITLGTLIERALSHYDHLSLEAAEARKSDQTGEAVAPGIGARIRVERQSRGWSQAYLAQRLGVAQSTVGRVELNTGNRVCGWAHKAANVMDIPISRLFLPVLTMDPDPRERELERLRRTVASLEATLDEIKRLSVKRDEAGRFSIKG